ncbi:MAG: sialidase family protein [Opitutaceae bacterium]|nr:sialidase family protein [Opitutaceae bacterium]
MRPAFCLLLLITFAAAAERVAPAPVVGIERILTPAGPGSSGASLATAPDGTVWLTWLEPVASPTGATALRCSTFDAIAKKWRPATTIAQGANWFVNWADFPALTVGENGAAVAVWYANNPPPRSGAATADSHDHHGPGYRAFINHTSDGGRTWTTGVPLTRESESVEFVSLATLADGRVLATWLDGRSRRAGKPQQLYARVIGASGADMLVDASVCDCCQTALTPFPDGTALLAYRGRGDQEVRDIRVTRFRGNRWDEPRPLNQDDWRINGCPVNGPQLASDGGRVAVAWFTAADNDPRVLASYSPDAGARFLMPLRLDHTKPSGRVDTLLLRDGAMLVTWLAADGEFWLGRVSPEFTTDDPVLLAKAAADRAGGFPRTALLQDYRGGRTAAQFIAAFTTGGKTTSVDTVLVTVPEGELLATGSNCDCAPTPEQLQGFSMRGTFIAANPPAGTVQVKHYELPGIFAAGTREFKVAPATLSTFAPDRQFFGRIEKREGAWWLYDLRFIATPKP